MRHWKTLLIWTAVAAVALTVVAVAAAQTRGGATNRARGACAALMSNPNALQDMQALRAEHLKDMQAWRDKYGADPNGAAAQHAQQLLRQEHAADMQTLLKKYGIASPQGTGIGMMGGAGCAGAGAGCGATAPGNATTGGTGHGGGMMGGTGSGSGMMGAAAATSY